MHPKPSCKRLNISFSKAWRSTKDETGCLLGKQPGRRGGCWFLEVSRMALAVAEPSSLGQSQLTKGVWGEVGREVIVKGTESVFWNLPG